MSAADYGRPAAAAGFAVHGGWTIAVTIALEGDRPVVVDRRRIELAVPDLPSHPYHHEALRMKPADGEALVRRVRQAVSERARQALRALQADVARSVELAAVALRESRPLPAAFADILATRAVYIADSELYRDAVHDAAREIGVRIFVHPKDAELAFAAQAAASNPDDLAQRVRDWRKVLGSPWQKDHRAAAAAAMGALASLSAPR